MTTATTYACPECQDTGDVGLFIDSPDEPCSACRHTGVNERCPDLIPGQPPCEKCRRVRIQYQRRYGAYSKSVVE